MFQTLTYVFNIFRVTLIQQSNCIFKNHLKYHECSNLPFDTLNRYVQTCKTIMHVNTANEWLTLLRSGTHCDCYQHLYQNNSSFSQLYCIEIASASRLYSRLIKYKWSRQLLLYRLKYLCFYSIQICSITNVRISISILLVVRCACYGSI